MEITGSEWLNGLFIEDCGLVYVGMMNNEQTEVEDDKLTLGREEWLHTVVFVCSAPV